MDKRLCEAWLFKVGKDKKGKDKKIPTKNFHDFRRSAARDMIEAGVPEKTAMEITGHKTRSMLDRYNIVNETQKRDAVRKTHQFRTSRTEPAQGEEKGNEQQP